MISGHNNIGYLTKDEWNPCYNGISPVAPLSIWLNLWILMYECIAVATHCEDDGLGWERRNLEEMITRGRSRVGLTSTEAHIGSSPMRDG
jgi:hypothetical protein